MTPFLAQCCVSRQTIHVGAPCRVALFLQGDFPSISELSGSRVLLSSGRASSAESTEERGGAPQTAFLRATFGGDGDFRLVLDAALARDQALSALAQVYKRALQTNEATQTERFVSFDFPAFLQENAPGVLAELESASMFNAYATVGTDALDAEIDAAWSYLTGAVIDGDAFAVDDLARPVPLRMFVAHEFAYCELRELASEGDVLDLASPFGVIQDALAAGLKQLEAVHGLDVEAAQAPSATDSLASKFESAMKVLTLGVHLPVGVIRAHTKGIFERVQAAGHAVPADIRELADLNSDFFFLRGMLELQLDFSPVTFMAHDEFNSVGRRFAEFAAEVANRVRIQLLAAEGID